MRLAFVASSQRITFAVKTNFGVLQRYRSRSFMMEIFHVYLCHLVGNYSALTFAILKRSIFKRFIKLDYFVRLNGRKLLLLLLSIIKFRLISFHLQSAKFIWSQVQSLLDAQCIQQIDILFYSPQIYIRLFSLFLT